MRNKILIVDDEEVNRELLKQMFEKDYEILEASNGKDAIVMVGKYMDEIAIILLDIMMPVLNGYQVLQVLSAKKIINKIPVILITASDDEKAELQCYSLGATAVITKPFATKVVIKRVLSTIEMYKNIESLELTVESQNKEILQQRKMLELYNEHLLDAISNIVEFRNLESGMHVKRIKGFTKILANHYKELYPESGLTEEKIEIIVRGAATHDIGKIAIPDSILLKPGRLTDEEREVMMSHTTKGCEILNMLGDVQDQELFKVSYDIIRYHHERADGNGYPDNLEGDEIPLSAQLVSVADVYDALVSERVYKKPVDKKKAFEMILTGECGTFDKKLMTAFAHAKTEFEEYADAEQ